MKFCGNPECIGHLDREQVCNFDAPRITNPKEAQAFVHRLRLTVAKTRSNAIEAAGAELAEMLSPDLFESETGNTLRLADVLNHLGDKEISYGTLNNLLYFTRKVEGLNAMHYARWEEDIPESYSMPVYEGGM